MDQVEEIKNRLDIVDVVKDYIKLKKAGANFRAPCPFHSDKKPSLFVSPSKQIWKCFGCGLGGDAFEFVKEIEGVEFPEALEILARKAGVKLKKISPEGVSKKKRLYEIMDLSSKFFEKQLAKSKAGKQAKKYLVEERGISEESIKKWRLGYAPSKWRALSSFLSQCGYTREEMEKVGIGIRNEKGNFYDRFRGRIMFPVFDFHSRVIGFGGRVFKDEDKTAKYVNTTNTPLYNKSKVLYGLNNSKVDIRKEDACIVAEGYTDVILSHQAGVKNIVASSGTALAPYQLRILRRYTENLYFAFDMDVAGRSATKRGISLAQKEGFNVYIILMPGGHDPADVIAKDPGKWKKMVEGAKGILDFYFETTFSKFDPEKPKDKKKIAKTLLPVIKRIQNEIERFHWIQKLAGKLKVTEESVEKELRKVKLEEEKNPESFEEPEEEKKTKGEMLEDQLLFFFLQDPEGAGLLDKKDLEYFSTEGVEVFSIIKEEGVELERLEGDLSPSLFKKVKMASLQVEVEGEVEDLEREIKNCVAEIKRWRMKREMRAISERLKEAEKEEDASKIEMLTEEFNKLSKKIEP